MSYCRWSGDDFQCDLYCYESDEGFVTHVAVNRVVFAGPLPPPTTGGDVNEWMKRDFAVSDMINEAKREPIGLPHDGETFVDATLEDMLERAESLRAAGYKVPDYALESMRDEIEADRDA